MLNEKIDYTIIVAPSVNDRIKEHFEFLARVNENAANKLLDILTKDLESLEKMPFRNPVYERPFVQSLKYRYLISNKRYRIIYQIVDDFVFVDVIQDCRQKNDGLII